MEDWRTTWREGIAPQLSTMGLEALRRALITDDPRLIQGKTCSPPPLQCVQDWPLDAGCGITYCGWQGGEGVKNVRDAEAFFARICFEVDLRIGEPAVCRFLNWFDETPREEMRRQLLAEVSRSLALRDNKETPDESRSIYQGTDSLSLLHG